MIKKPRTSNLKKGSNTKEQKTSFFKLFTKNSNNSNTQNLLTSPHSNNDDSDDDDIERDVSKKEDSLKELKILINKNNQDEIKAFLSNKNNKYILHDAVEDKEQKSVENILELAKYLTRITYKGSTVLHSAVKGIANVEIIKALLAKNPYLVTQKDASGLTPLCYSTSKEILKILQEYERNVMDFLIKKPQYVPITHPKCFPIEEVPPNWGKDFEECTGHKLVGQTNPNINSDEF